MKRIALCALLVCGAAVAWAGPVKVYSGKNTAVSNAHLVPTLSGDEFAYDKFTIEAYFDGGGDAYWSSRLHNLGPGDGKCEVKSRLRMNGEILRAKHDLDEGKYTIIQSPPRFIAGDHSLFGSVDKIHVQGRGKGYSFNLVFEPIVGAWRPGSGRVTFPNGTYFDTTLLAPKARVSGTVKVGDQAREVTGYGYATHSHSNVAPHDQAKRFIEFRHLEGDTVIWLKEFITSDDFGGVRVPYLLVAHKGKVVVSSTDFDVKYGAWETDTASEQRYRIPMQLVIRARDGANEVTLGIKVGKQLKRNDELKKMGVLERAVVSRLMKPISYRYEAEFEIRGTGGTAFTATGRRAPFVVSHLNP